MTTEIVPSPNVQISTTGWSPTKELDVEAWLAEGKMLHTIGRAYKWWLGDWIRYGTKRYGQMYLEAMQMTGLALGTLTNAVSIADAYPPATRRDNVSWSHHYELAPLPPAEREIWLDLVEKDGLSVAQLVHAVRGAKKAPPAIPASKLPPGPPEPTAAPQEDESPPETDGPPAHQGEQLQVDEVIAAAAKAEGVMLSAEEAGRLLITYLHPDEQETGYTRITHNGHTYLITVERID